MTLIDKAEAHDDDLIRRGDALYAIAGWEIPSTAIAALPARGMGVQDARDALEELANMPLGIPLEDWARLSARILAALDMTNVQKMHISALAPTDAAQARVIRNGEHLFNTAKSLGWADDGEGALEFVMRRTREVALEDAAQAREVALREAVAKATEHMDMHNGRDMNSYRAALGVRDAILALIGEARNDAS